MYIRARDVAEVRHETQRWTSGHAAKFLHMYLVHPELRADVYVPDELKHLSSATQAAVLARNEERRLERAELYYVAEEMTMVTLGAARSLPSYSLHPDDVPAPYGFVVWEAPIAMAARKGRFHKARDVPVVAASWGEAGGGTWVSFWTDANEAKKSWLDLGAMTETEIHEASTTGLFGPLCYEREVVFWYADKAYWPSHLQSPEAEIDEDSIVLIDPNNPEAAESEHLHRVMLATWLLMGQRIAAEETLRTPRPAQKRISRAGGTPADVRLITLRQTRRAAESAAESSRDWKHRWVVVGHWRNHWWPKRQEHRQTWIHQYVKGPEGAPLLGGEKVRVLRR